MKMKTAVATAALFLSLFAFQGSALSTTLVVPWEFGTIQEGIDAAVDGDMILVALGTYHEDIDFLGKGVVILAESGADVTVLDGGQAGPVVTFAGGETDQAILSGFTVTNGSAELGGGILCMNSSPIIMYCTISDNVAGALGGGGIACTNSASPMITNSTIVRNSSSSSGGGVLIDLSTPYILDCLIGENSATDDGGGILVANGSNPKIKGCIISDNMAVAWGGGIDVTDSSSMIGNCTIIRNQALDGGGISFYAGTDLNVLHCTLSDNTADTGGGILCNASPVLIQNCILWDDSAPLGPEIAVIDGADVQVGYSDVRDGEPAAHVDPGSILTWKEGNIDTEPLFVGSGDYHLVAESPCIDSGTNAGIYNDIDNEDRPVHEGFDMGSDEYSGPLPVECGECDGKVTELTLLYTGTITAFIEVEQKKEGIIFEGMIDPGETFTFVGQDNKGTMGPWIELFIDGVFNTTIHTSCSVPIGPGLVSGDFEVIEGYSRNGGRLCPVTPPPAGGESTGNMIRLKRLIKEAGAAFIKKEQKERRDSLR